MKSGGLLLGLGALSLLFFFSGSSLAAQAPTPFPPAPPPPPPPPKPKPAPTEPPGDLSFFNYATGEAAPPESFLNWDPGKIAPPPAPAKPPARATVLPKAGEKWQMVWSLNRPLSFLEMIAGKAAFRSMMTNQTLDSSMQNVGPPTTVTLQTTFTKDSDGPIPLGQTLQKSGIVAKLTSMKKVG